jgi:hypothetical protein
MRTAANEWRTHGTKSLDVQESGLLGLAERLDEPFVC